MNDTKLEGISACVFDAYGTLFDYASAAARCRDLLGDKLGCGYRLFHPGNWTKRREPRLG